MSWREEISEDVLGLISLIASLYYRQCGECCQPVSQTSCQNAGRSPLYNGLEGMQNITFEKLKHAAVAIQSSLEYKLN